jgi:hypothetical protein
LNGRNVIHFFNNFVKTKFIFYQKLLSMGASPYEEPNDVGGNIKVAMVKDPWENLFGIIFNPHFGVGVIEKIVNIA